METGLLRRGQFVANITFKMLLRNSMVFLVCVFSGCIDIIEEDISGEQIVIYSPSATGSTASGTVSFFWSEIEYANRYRLTVVSPDFNEPVNLHLDTNVGTNNFRANLGPGSYTVRLTGFNDAYQSLPTTRNFVLDSTQSISGIDVSLLEPHPNFITSEQELRFSWSEVINADDYRFEVRVSSQSGPLVFPPALTEDTEVVRTLNEGIFVWGVQAQNSQPSGTAFSYRNLIVDITNPNPAELIFPSNNMTFLNDTIFTFQWMPGEDELTLVVDSLIIYYPSGEAIVRTPDVPGQLQLDTDSLLFGLYNWGVVTTDEAGNQTLSEQYEFTIE